MGIQVPDDEWPQEQKYQNNYTIPKAQELARKVVKTNTAGMTPWSLQKPSQKLNFFG